MLVIYSCNVLRNIRNEVEGGLPQEEPTNRFRKAMIQQNGESQEGWPNKPEHSNGSSGSGKCEATLVGTAVGDAVGSSENGSFVVLHHSWHTRYSLSQISFWNIQV